MSLIQTFSIRPYDTRVRLLEPLNGINVNSRIMYFLPVEQQGSLIYGDPLQEVININAYDDYDFIYVYPEFPNVPSGPWYAREEEKTMVEQLKAYIDGLYPQLTLPPIAVGFSKSGWGLFSMMLNDPSLFVRGIIFDAPVSMDSAQFGSDYLFRGEFSQFDLNIRAPNANWIADQIYLVRYVDHTASMIDMHDLLDLNLIPHFWEPGTSETHSWSGTWFNRIFTTYTQGL